MHSIGDLDRRCVEVLEPNLQFHRQGPGDDARYLVGPEVLQALAWVATSIALPILLSGAAEVVKDRVKDWLESRKGRRASDATQSEAEQSEPDAPIEAEISEQHREQAIGAIAELLMQRGWPRAFAVADATEIVVAIEKAVKRTQ